MTIKFNKDQLAALDAASKFLSTPSERYFVLSGFAGTGKTTCMKELVKRNKKIRFAFTAPTNKAAKVLRGVVGEATTIYKLLGLRLDSSGEFKEIVANAEIDLSSIDVIVIDEASMINSKLFDFIESLCQRFMIQVLFMGDPEQLRPVKEERSRVWDLPIGAQLTKVERHDNAILAQVTRTRHGDFTFVNDNDGVEGVWYASQLDFYNWIKLFALQMKEGNAKIISWRNVKVDEYNQIIRRELYGQDAYANPFMSGERLVMAAPVERDGSVIMSTDDEAIVKQTKDAFKTVPAAVTNHCPVKEYQTIIVQCETELGTDVELEVIHPNSAHAWRQNNDTLALLAREKRIGWHLFWLHHGWLDNVKYAYAITAHRSQGSSYNTVFVDAGDIMRNSNRDEMRQCLYVAQSRAMQQLIIS